MRLTPSQTQLIADSVHRHFGAQSKIWLFGSRTDDCKRGGDVDLYVETDRPELLHELRCKISLEEALDLHVDLVIKKPGDAK
jgi:predicted nucleotidyltransferase